MERSRFLQTLDDHAAGLFAAARATDPGTPVPGCPDWVMSDLVWHVATVHDFWAYVVRESAQSPDGYEQLSPPGESAKALGPIADVAVGRAAELHRVLATVDSSLPVWTWAGAETAGWVIRRMAHETAVHRVDAERAAGRAFRLDPELAADGIDEFLTYFLARSRAAAGPLEGTVHLHCTDADGEWTVSPSGDDGFVVTREHAKGDVALRGDAHDLLMVLWRRSGLDAVTLFGDPALAARFVGAPEIGGPSA